MTSNPNTLRAMVKGSAFAFIFISALAFASPAQAEKVTLSCEGDRFVNGASVPISWTVDIDYTAKTVKFDLGGALELSAAITEREIAFFRRDDTDFIQGTMDRLAGTMSATRIKLGKNLHLGFQGRCRPAAKPKW